MTAPPKSIIPNFSLYHSKLALPTNILCPEFCSQFGLETQFQIILPSVKSLKSLEFLVRRFEFRITVMDDFRRSALERFFRRDALEPALLGKLLMR